MSSLVLTLIAAASPNPGGAAPLDDSMARRLAEGLEKAGGRPGPADWLCPGIALDLPVEGLAPQAIGEIAKTVTATAEPKGMPVDIAVQAATGRRKKLLVADMESTIIANEMLDEMGEMLGNGPSIAEITRRAMNGEIDFAEALRERVATLAGESVNLLERARERILLTHGAATLVATMAAHGAYTALVSGGFRYFTAHIARHLGFDEERANDLEIVGGHLTGRVVEPILDRNAKQQALEELTARLGLSLDETLAVGDGANDLPMLQRAGMGVAFHAKPRVAAEAGLRIDHGDLTALLYLQGYRRAAFRDVPDNLSQG